MRTMFRSTVEVNVPDVELGEGENFPLRIGSPVPPDVPVVEAFL